MDDLRELARGYRMFLVELGEHFKRAKEDKTYEGYADTFIDMVKSPEIGFSVAETEGLIKLYEMFGALPADDLPSHHAMRMMVRKKVDMALLESANTLSVADFKELIKDEEMGTQERTYVYEIMKRCVETNSFKKVYGDELEEAKKHV
jgi:hypothetical protein